MKLIEHEFSDSLNQFIKENPDSGLRDWLKIFSKDKLSRLEALLHIVESGENISVSNPIDLHEMQTNVFDMHYLAFEVASVGKKRKV